MKLLLTLHLLLLSCSSVLAVKHTRRLGGDKNNKNGGGDKNGGGGAEKNNKEGGGGGGGGEDEPDRADDGGGDTGGLPVSGGSVGGISGVECAVKKPNEELGVFYQRGGMPADALTFCAKIGVDDPNFATMCGVPAGMTPSDYCSDMPGSCGYAPVGTARTGCCRYFSNEIVCDLSTTFSHLPCVCWDGQRGGQAAPSPPIPVPVPSPPVMAPIMVPTPVMDDCMKYNDDMSMNPFAGIPYGDGLVTIGCTATIDCAAFPVTRSDGSVIPRCCIKDKCICRSAVVNDGMDCVM